MKMLILLASLLLVGCGPRTVPIIYQGMHESRAEHELYHAHPRYYMTSVHLDIDDMSFTEWFTRTSGDSTCDYIHFRVKNHLVSDVQYFTF